MTLANWRSLAVKLGVPSKTFKLFERRSTQSPTNQLFEYLGSTCPHMTVKTLEEAMKKMERKDLLAILHEKSPQGKLNSFLRGQQMTTIFHHVNMWRYSAKKKNVNYRNGPRESLLTLLLTFCFIRSIRSSIIFRKEMILNLLSFLYSAICEFLSSLKYNVRNYQPQPIITRLKNFLGKWL